jgi:hypothetical protein
LRVCALNGGQTNTEEERSGNAEPHKGYKGHNYNSPNLMDWNWGSASHEKFILWTGKKREGAMLWEYLGIIMTDSFQNIGIMSIASYQGNEFCRPFIF